MLISNEYEISLKALTVSCYILKHFVLAKPLPKIILSTFLRIFCNIFLWATRANMQITVT